MGRPIAKGNSMPPLSALHLEMLRYEVGTPPRELCGMFVLMLMCLC